MLDLSSTDSVDSPVAKFKTGTVNEAFRRRQEQIEKLGVSFKWRKDHFFNYAPEANNRGFSET